MRVLRILSIVALIAMLAVIAGCERKVVNENKSDDQGLPAALVATAKPVSTVRCNRPRANGQILCMRPVLASTTLTD